MAGRQRCDMAGRHGGWYILAESTSAWDGGEKWRHFSPFLPPPTSLSMDDVYWTASIAGAADLASRAARRGRLLRDGAGGFARLVLPDGAAAVAAARQLDLIDPSARRHLGHDETADERVFQGEFSRPRWLRGVRRYAPRIRRLRQYFEYQHPGVRRGVAAARARRREAADIFRAAHGLPLVGSTGPPQAQRRIDLRAAARHVWQRSRELVVRAQRVDELRAREAMEAERAMRRSLSPMELERWHGRRRAIRDAAAAFAADELRLAERRAAIAAAERAFEAAHRAAE